MGRLGDALRSQRERKGITLEQAAEDTRIRQKFLESLESGDHQALPGAVYTKGFLRNYADYLDLDGDELIGLYTAERAEAPEPPRSFEPMKPIMRRNVFISPSLLIPLLVVVAVALFVLYLSYQFTAFATPPRLEIFEPAGDTIVRAEELTVRGRTVPGARVTVRVFPGPQQGPDVIAGADGAFSAEVRLSPGANHIEVQVLDAAGKVNQLSRSVRFETVVRQAEEPGGPQLVVERPRHGEAISNSAVEVVGRVSGDVQAVLVNGQQAELEGGRFSDTINFVSGTHELEFVARAANGSEVSETRVVSVSFTTSVVTVVIQGGDAWLQVEQDGVPVPGTGRVFPAGTIQTYTGERVSIRTGNAGATTIVHNGELLGRLGDAGEVVSRSFTYP